MFNFNVKEKKSKELFSDWQTVSQLMILHGQEKQSKSSR